MVFLLVLDVVEGEVGVLVGGVVRLGSGLNVGVFLCGVLVKFFGFFLVVNGVCVLFMGGFV